MELDLIISIAIPLISCGVTLGICKNKIEQNEKEIKELKLEHSKDIQIVLEKQQNTDELLQRINEQLIELNTKMSLLLRGKINLEES